MRLTPQDSVTMGPLRNMNSRFIRPEISVEVKPSKLWRGTADSAPLKVKRNSVETVNMYGHWALGFRCTGVRDMQLAPWKRMSKKSQKNLENLLLRWKLVGESRQRRREKEQLYRYQRGLKKLARSEPKGRQTQL